MRKGRKGLARSAVIGAHVQTQRCQVEPLEPRTLLSVSDPVTDASVTSAMVAPSTAAPDQSVDIYYSFNSSSFASVLLGVGIEPSGSGTTIELAGAVGPAVQIPAGPSVAVRVYTVPANVTSDTYDLITSLYIDANGDGQIDDGPAFFSKTFPNAMSVQGGTVDQPPATPVNLSPADGAILEVPTVTLQAGPFSDPDAGDTQSASEWIVRKSSDGSTTFHSGADSTDLTSIAIPAGTLAYSTPYSWQVRYQDNHGTWSDYSTPTGFTVAAPPSIVVQLAGAALSNGQATPIDFGSVTQGQNTSALTFTVQNTGGLPLTLGNVAVPDGYTVTGDLASPLAVGASETFTIRLDNLVTGTKPGQISFSTGDPNNLTFGVPITGQVTPATATPLTLTSRIGDGTRQRSLIRSLALTFSGTVSLAPGAITMSRRNAGGSGADDGSAPTDLSADLTISSAASDSTAWHVGFLPDTPAADASGGLTDGIYDIIVHASGVAASNGGSFADQTITFFRLFGDANGDGVVNNADYFQFTRAFGSKAGDGAFSSIFDADANGAINNADYFQFKKRFGHKLNLAATTP